MGGFVDQIPDFNAPFTLGAQLDARANDQAVAALTAVRHGDRSWTYLQFRDEAVRFAHFLLRRLGPAGAAGISSLTGSSTRRRRRPWCARRGTTCRAWGGIRCRRT